MAQKTIAELILIFLAVIFSAGEIFANNNCGAFDFPERPDNIFLTEMKSSLGKVYWDEKGIDYHGTATLIDLKQRLLLTAAHVVGNKSKVYLYFPFLGDQKLWPAQIIERLPPAVGEDELNGAAWDKARDIALIQLEQLPRNLKPAEVWLETLNQDQKISFYGFPDNSGTVVVGQAVNQSIPRPKHSSVSEPLPSCTRDLREITVHGDSGSPILNPRGLIIGIVIHANNEFKFARFVPTTCFRAFLTTIYEKNYKDFGKEIFVTFVKSSLGEAINMLRPPPSEDWISNLEFRSMMIFAATSSEVAKELKEKHDCPLRLAIWHRGIGLDVYDNYARVFLRPSLEAAFIKDLGAFYLWEKIKNGLRFADDFYSEGEFLEKQGKGDIAQNLYKHSEDNYKTVLSVSGAYGDIKDSINLEWSEKDRSFISHTFEELSKVQRKLSILSKDRKLAEMAKENAAKAVVWAPNELERGRAYAALGVTAQNTGEHQLAIEAYTSAAKSGYNPEWLESGNKELQLLEAWKIADAKNNSEITGTVVRKRGNLYDVQSLEGENVRLQVDSNWNSYPLQVGDLINAEITPKGYVLQLDMVQPIYAKEKNYKDLEN